MYTDKKISFFTNYRTILPHAELSILQFCNYIKSHHEHSKQIEKIRHPATSDKERRDLKASLPAVTISGTFKRRAEAGLTQHSGFICIDIDKNDNPGISDWQGLRDDLMHGTNIFFAALSASGQGVFCLIPIQYPDKHRLHSKQLLIDFQRKTDIIPDSSCTDVSRLRGISIDPQAKINAEAIPYSGLFMERQPVYRQPQFSDPSNVDRLIELISESMVDITSFEPDWFAIGCALAGHFGEEGRLRFHLLSKFYTYYSEKETNDKYDTCLKLKSMYSIGTLFYIAAKHGINLREHHR